MKEQGKDFDPSKEPVRNETVGKIVGECHRIFSVKLPFLPEDYPDERPLRICKNASGYGEGQIITVFKDGKIVMIDEKFDKKYREFLARKNGENVYTIFLTENLRNKNFIDWDSYVEDKSGQLSYIHIVDFDGNDSFMQTYVTPKGYSKAKKFSPLQKERVAELLREGFPVGSLDVSDLERDVLSNPIIPSEEFANNLLRFMKTLTEIQRFSPPPPF